MYLSRPITQGKVWCTCLIILQHTIQITVVTKCITLQTLARESHAHIYMYSGFKKKFELK